MEVGYFVDVWQEPSEWKLTERQHAAQQRQQQILLL
jgi:hypothetical protein